MKNYVVVSDLIRNDGEYCTILEKEPKVDHVIIEVDDYYPHVKRLLITHDNIEAFINDGLVMRVMREDPNLDPDEYVTIDDLNNARMELFRLKICDGCWHFRDWNKAIEVPHNRCKCRGDNLRNYKEGNCPYKSPGCREDIIKVIYTPEGRIIVLMKGNKELFRSLPNESVYDFMTRIDLSCLS